MSVKEYYKVKQVEQKTKVLEEVCCGKCGKLLDVSGDGIVRNYCDKKGNYFRLVTGHNLWSHDSVESIEVDYYCEDCLKEVFEEWLKQAENTHYFEIKCEGDINTFKEYSTDGLEVEQDD